MRSMFMRIESEQISTLYANHSYDWVSFILIGNGLFNGLNRVITRIGFPAFFNVW
ncbi:MAG: hypothetical protein KF888_10935 [Nitrosomonas sp.]|nr:hypothetical protein [Nitrosomonas sp.]